MNQSIITNPVLPIQEESCESHDSSVQNGISHLCLELINDSFAKGHILSTTPKYTRMYQLGSLKTPSPFRHKYHTKKLGYKSASPKVPLSFVKSRATTISIK